MSSSILSRRGLMLVLSSPSGAGKTTISRTLLKDDENLTLSVSVTTRAKRSTERDGVDYYFIDEKIFLQMAKDNLLLEHAKVFGNFYGTPLQPVEDALSAGRDVLFDIDWQGTQQIQSKMPHDTVRVFVLPPSYSELEARLRRRAEDSQDVVDLRMSKAAEEMSHYDAYDYVIINEQLDKSVAQLKAILLAERCRRHRLIGLDSFVNSLKEKA